MSSAANLPPQFRAAPLTALFDARSTQLAQQDGWGVMVSHVSHFYYARTKNEPDVDEARGVFFCSCSGRERPRSKPLGPSASESIYRSCTDFDAYSTTIADLVVALGTGQIKTGAPCRSERVAKVLSTFLAFRSCSELTS